MRRKIGLVAVVGFVSLLGAGIAAGTTPSVPEPIPESAFHPVIVSAPPTVAPTHTPFLVALPPTPTQAPRPKPKTPAPKPIVKVKPKPQPKPKLVSYPSVAYARSYARSRIGATQFTCLDKLFTRESNWRTHAYSRSSGAYGIPQALPGTKMSVIASDWRDNPLTQVRWGLRYIAGRYGTACNAWAHSQRVGWY